MGKAIKTNAEIQMLLQARFAIKRARGIKPNAVQTEVYRRVTLDAIADATKELFGN